MGTAAVALEARRLRLTGEALVRRLLVQGQTTGVPQRAIPQKCSSVGILERRYGQNGDFISDGVNDSVRPPKPGRTESLQVAEQLLAKSWFLVEPRDYRLSFSP